MKIEDRISMEHQLRYETARANMYARVLKTLVDSIYGIVSDAKVDMKGSEQLLDHDWSKLLETGIVMKGEMK